MNFESDISDKVLEGISTGKGFNADAYLQEKFEGQARPDSVEINNIFQSLEKLIQSIKQANNDPHRRRQRTTVRLAFNELSITMASMIRAATIDTRTEVVGFRLLMTHSLKRQCTNKSDLVYQLLGLHEHKTVSQITPDYNLSIQRVFSDFSVAAIRCTGLNFFYEYEEMLSRFYGDLPSWVVSLTRGREVTSEGEAGEWSHKWKMFCAGGGRTDDIGFSINNDQLYCQGLLYKVDTKTLMPKYRDKDLIRDALERVVSCYTPDEGRSRSVLNISTQTTSEDFEVASAVEMIQGFWALHSDFAIEGIRLESLYPGQDDIKEWNLDTATELARNELLTKIFITTDGKLGLGKQGLKDGNNVAILRGCNVPTILRKHEGGYKMIGMCYLDGVMFGEVFDEKLIWEELTIL